MLTNWELIILGNADRSRENDYRNVFRNIVINDPPGHVNRHVDPQFTRSTYCPAMVVLMSGELYLNLTIA
jgi:hypothetical protein